MIRTCLAAAAVLFLSCGGCHAEPPPSEKAVSSSAKAEALLPVVIRTAKGDVTFQVEVARTPTEQQRGLMYRDRLDPLGGMLFPFDPPEIASFWMKNTLIPLDMIFIRADGSIARIAPDTVPYSLAPITSGEAVVAVLEIGGGRAAATGVAEGDRASWPGGPAR